MNASSYTSAGVLPAKLIRQAGQIFESGRVKPLHVQISPTNVCQLECEFCSCANRQRNDYMPTADFCEIMSKFVKWGCKAVTVTGGGEPTLHAEINKLLLFMKQLRLEIGLVSNGVSLDRLKEDAIQALTWCRISFSDNRAFDTSFLNNILGATLLGKQVDWAFSYVLTAQPNWDNLSRIVELGNELNFTHIRIVTDLLDLDGAPDMEDARRALFHNGIDDSRVIYQGRKEFTHGRRNCWISLLKPVIGTDGLWYPCCGLQYALSTPGLDFERAMCMGSVDVAYAAGEPFDGSVCSRCYYDDYNHVLDVMARPLQHEAFV